MPITYTTYDEDGSETEHKLPSRWEICDVCRGNGTTTRHIECDGGGFTGSEWAEACHDDPDFADNYFSGVYDRPCPDCNGSGKVQVVDRESVSPAILASMEADADEEAEYQAMRAAERRMGC